ncbi:MAG: dihydrolipoyl dehydrogenase [Chromatiales bacterium]|jgi:dihydrolipoamide dehydrogenase|nr:dihydrolipoyl dehydrogenase [Chromatiales bacterium]
MVVGNMPEATDLVVVGAGPGGYTAALHAARAGRRVLLVDTAGEEGIGGVCLNVGCIPSKALIELAHLHDNASHAQSMGLKCSGVEVDLAAFQLWKAGIIENLTRGVKTALKRAKVEIRRGHFRLLGAHSGVINDHEGGAQFVDFKGVVLATGSSPVALDALPVDGERVVDSTGALAFEALPKSLAVVGAGYVGVELGTAFAKLGVPVTLIEATGQLLPGMDSHLVRAVSRRMTQLGVQTLINARVVSLSDAGLHVERQDGTEEVLADRIIVAVGRRPNTANLGLEDVDVEVLPSGHLQVDSQRLVRPPSIAAIGDITLGPALAHKAIAEARVAVDALAGKPAAFEPECIPAIVFSDPEIASVGLTGEAAKAAGIETRSVRAPLGSSGRAATLGATIGTAELVVNVADHSILGVHLAGPHASELIASAGLAIEMGALVDDLALTIHPHPTLSEQINELALRFNSDSG